MRFSPAMSQLVAAATVNGVEAITNCVKAYERQGAGRLECLTEAKADLLDWLAELDAAITSELVRAA